MAGGLVTEAEVQQFRASESDGPEFTATSAVDGAPVESHLDSFFGTSGWTRTDALVVLSLAQTVLLLFVAHREVTA